MHLSTMNMIKKKHHYKQHMKANYSQTKSQLLHLTIQKEKRIVQVHCAGPRSSRLQLLIEQVKIGNVIDGLVSILSNVKTSQCISSLTIQVHFKFNNSEANLVSSLLVLPQSSVNHVNADSHCFITLNAVSLQVSVMFIGLQ